MLFLLADVRVVRAAVVGRKLGKGETSEPLTCNCSSYLSLFYSSGSTYPTTYYKHWSIISEDIAPGNNPSHIHRSIISNNVNPTPDTGTSLHHTRQRILSSTLQHHLISRRRSQLTSRQCLLRPCLTIQRPERPHLGARVRQTTAIHGVRLFTALVRLRCARALSFSACSECC